MTPPLEFHDSGKKRGNSRHLDIIIL